MLNLNALPEELIHIIQSYSYSPQSKELLEDIKSFYMNKKKSESLYNYKLRLRDFLYLRQYPPGIIIKRFHRYNKFVNICFNKHYHYIVYIKICELENYFNILFGLMNNNERIEFINFLHS